ncbi:MAG: hypothetical protein GY884_10405 [Proteobacteria bacterium]|nr:hypothetical protein [Pseudomonadota bacterium]
MSILFWLACTGGVEVPPVDSEPEIDETDQVYDLDHLMRVDIELPEDDWDDLRTQSRTWATTIGQPDCQEQPFESPFTWFEARVTIDGELYERADVRKKGFLGSMNEDKPSLKLDLGEFDDEATFHGMRRLTLNNSLADASFARQCVAYGFFRDAGLPAPRCSLAQVTVNGDDLGVFVNLEPLKKPFLEREFGDDSGNLYEGTLADFREGWTGPIEKKTNESEGDFSDVEQLTEALTVPDSELFDALEPIVDVDQFLDFWASEVIVQHTDGYASNTNNYYLYADPSDGRFRFIPWGMDAVFYGEYAEDFQDEPGFQTQTVYASGVLVNRIIEHPDGPELYEAALRGMLEHWEADDALSRADRMRDVIEPEFGSRKWGAVEEQLEFLEYVVESREPDLLEALEAAPPSWPYGMRDSYCFVPQGSVQAEFSGTWESFNRDPWTYGESSLLLSLDDEPAAGPYTGGVIGGESEGAAVFYQVTSASETLHWLVYITVPPDDMKPGTVELDLGERIGAIMVLDTETMTDFEFVAYLMGDVTFEDASMDAGEPLVGSFEGQLLVF